MRRQMRIEDYKRDDIVKVITDVESFTGYIYDISILEIIWVQTDNDGIMKIDLNKPGNVEEVRVVG